MKWLWKAFPVSQPSIGKDAHLYSTARSTCRYLSVNALQLPPWQGYSTQSWCEDSRKLPANIPMESDAWPVWPIVPWHYQYSFTPEWDEALWSPHLAQGCYIVNQLAALWFEPVTFMDSESHMLSTLPPHLHNILPFQEHLRYKSTHMKPLCQESTTATT